MNFRQYLDDAPFALAMSSGFFSFFAHAGFVAALEDEGFAARVARISGSSAGALVGGAWAAGVSARELGRELDALERRDFWDPGVGGGLLRGRLFRARLEALLPTTRFEACRVPVAVSVFDVLARRTRVLASGDLPRAIHASCAVPFLFHPVWIDRRPYWDGGLLDRPGLAGMPAREPRVLFHHIASKSPWRVKQDVPRAAGAITLVLAGLPRSGPFALDAGRRAFARAREATKRALDRPIEGGVVVA